MQSISIFILFEQVNFSQNLYKLTFFSYLMDFKDKLIALLAKETKLKKEELVNLVTVPPDSKLGDFAFPCFKLGKNPKEEAEKLKKKIKPPKFISKLEVVGPYLNFFLNQSVLTEETLTKIQKEKKEFGKSKTKKETIMVEFFHANTHKGVHIGHIRNISLGAAITNLLENIGKKVIRVNYQGDIGPHVAKCLWGYLHTKSKEPEKHKGIWLGKLYSEASKKIKKNPKLKEEIDELNTQIYQHDKKIEPLWKKTKKWCLDDFSDLYKDFGVKFDRLYFESEASPVGIKVFQKLLKKKIAKKSEGAIIVDLKKFGLDVYVGITSQGNPTYQVKDLGLAELKQKDFKFDKSVHVVGAEQKLYFKQVFKTFELMKSPLAGKSTHISYGLVMLPEGKMSSREGTMVLYHDLFNKLIELSKKEIKKRHKKLSKEETEKRAKIISFGALKFSMISKDNNRDVVFDWDQALSFEGETGPYVQYAHARACSVLKKAKKPTGNVNSGFLKETQEKTIVNLLSKFPETIKDAAENYRPHTICRYLIELAQSFNEFYHQCPVISEDKELMKARLSLVEAVKVVLAEGLGLLGIKSPEEM